MGRPCLLSLLLIAALLCLSFSEGSGRRIHVMRHYGRWHSPEIVQEEKAVVERVAVETVMDYEGPKANTNPRAGLPPGVSNDPPLH